MNILKNILKMELFRPHITDPNFPLNLRVPGKSMALVNYGSEYITVMKACLQKKWVFEEPKIYSPEDPQIEKALHDCSPDRLLAISYGDRTCITLEETSNELKHFINSPTQTKSIAAKTNPSSLLSTQNRYHKMGFNILRIQSTGLNLLNSMLAESMPKESCIIILDQEYMTGVKINNGHWTKVRSVLIENSDLLTQALEELLCDETECIKFWDTNSGTGRFQKIANIHGIENISVCWEPKNFVTKNPELELLTYA